MPLPAMVVLILIEMLARFEGKLIAYSVWSPLIDVRSAPLTYMSIYPVKPPGLLPPLVTVLLTMSFVYFVTLIAALCQE